MFKLFMFSSVHHNVSKNWENSPYMDPTTYREIQLNSHKHRFILLTVNHLSLGHLNALTSAHAVHVGYSGDDNLYFPCYRYVNMCDGRKTEKHLTY